MFETDDTGMVEKTVSLLNEYGDARFGDEWWPANARAWLGENEALDLERMLVGEGGDPMETARLMSAYAEEKFGDKWRPDRADSVLGPDRAEELRAALDALKAPGAGF